MCFISFPFLESAMFADSYHVMLDTGCSMLDKIFKFVDVYYR